ncbi:centrosomal protein of 192 kDa-like [Anneissia japonica]|uniref:centrosomal protein of 192 kDa-like n=1 Tax=Anneissia japonica TaxID=1529436 RepID=UPI0014257015|nr:centrosomal protein of 192 kDa-like [Anneissia japonica]
MSRRTASQMYLDESVLGGPVSRKTPVDNISMGSSPGVPMAASTVMKTNKYQEYLEEDTRGSFYGQQHFLKNPNPQGLTALKPSTFDLDRPGSQSPQQSKKKLKTKGLLDSLDSESSSDIDNFLKTHNLSDILEKMPSSNLSLSIRTDLGRDSLGRESLGLNNTGSSLGILSIDSMHDLSGSLLQIGSPTNNLREFADPDTTLTPDTPLSGISDEGSTDFGFLDTGADKAGTHKELKSDRYEISTGCLDCVIKSNIYPEGTGKDCCKDDGVMQRDFNTEQIQRSNSSIVTGRDSDAKHTKAKDNHPTSMQPMYSESGRRFTPEKLDSMFFEHSPMANIPRPGSGDGEEIFTPRLPSQGQEQTSSHVSLPKQTSKSTSDGFVTNEALRQNSANDISFAGSSLPFRQSQKSPPLGARRPSEGSEGSWQDAAITRQKKFTKSSHKKKNTNIEAVLKQDIRGRAIGSESMDSSEIDTEDELEAVRKELEERNSYVEPADRECIGESEESSNDGRPGLEGGSSDENDVAYNYNSIQGPRESAEGEVIAPVPGDGGGGGDGMSDGEDNNVASASIQPSLTTMDFFHGLGSQGSARTDQHSRNIEGRSQGMSQGPSRGQPVGNGTISSPFRQVRFASKDEVNMLSRLDSDSDYSRGRPSNTSISSDTSRLEGGDVELPSMFLNPNTHRHGDSALNTSGSQWQASSIHFEEGESAFDGDGKESMTTYQSPQRYNPFDQGVADSGQPFNGRSSLGDFGMGNMDITFSQKFSFGDDEFSQLETSARSSGSEHSGSTRSSSNTSRQVAGNSFQVGSESGIKEQHSSVYLDNDGQVVNDLAFRNSLPTMHQDNGPFSASDNSFTVDDLGFENDEFISGGDAKALIDEAEKSFQQENLFRQDEHMSPEQASSGQFDWSAGNTASTGVENILGGYKDIIGTEDFCRISIGAFMEARTETLGSLSGNGNNPRPEFGAGKVVSPSSGLPHALYDNVETLDDTSLQEASTFDGSQTLADDTNSETMDIKSWKTSKSNFEMDSGNSTYNVTSGSMSRTLTGDTSELERSNQDLGLDNRGNRATPTDKKSGDLDMTHTPAVNMSAIASAIVNASSSTKPQELAAMILALSNKPKDTAGKGVSEKSDPRSNIGQKEAEKRNSTSESTRQGRDNMAPATKTQYEKSSMFKKDMKKQEGIENQSKQSKTVNQSDQIPFSQNIKRSSRSSHGRETNLRERHSELHKDRQYNSSRPQRVGDGVEDALRSNSMSSNDSVESEKNAVMQYVTPYNAKRDVTEQQSREAYSKTSITSKEKPEGTQGNCATKKSDNVSRNLKSSDIGVRDFNAVVQLPEVYSLQSGEPKVGQVDPMQTASKPLNEGDDMEMSDAMVVEMLRKSRPKKSAQVVKNQKRQDTGHGEPFIKEDVQKVARSNHRPHAINSSKNGHDNVSRGSVTRQPHDQLKGSYSKKASTESECKTESKRSEPMNQLQPTATSRHSSTQKLKYSGQNEGLSDMQINNGYQPQDSSSCQTIKLPARPVEREQLHSIENKHKKPHEEDHLLDSQQKHLPKTESMIISKENSLNVDKSMSNVPRPHNLSDTGNHVGVGLQEPENQNKRSPEKKGKRSSPGKGRYSRRSRDSEVIIVGKHRIVPSELMSRPSDIMNETEDSFFNITQSQPNDAEKSPEQTVGKEIEDDKILMDIVRGNLSRQQMHVSPSQKSKKSISPRTHERDSDFPRPQQKYSSAAHVLPSPSRNRHAPEEHPHQPQLVSTASISNDQRYLAPQLSIPISSIPSHGFTNQTSLFPTNMHHDPISTFQPISDSRSLSVLPPPGKPTLLTSQSLLNTVVASQYLNDRPIMTTHATDQNSSHTSTGSSHFFGSTFPNAYGMLPPTSQGSRYLPVSSAQGQPAAGRAHFISTLPSGTTVPHFHGPSSLPHASIVTSLVVPRQLRFQGVCCVGIAAQAKLPLHNPSSRWLQCSLEVVSVTVNGEESNPGSKPSFLVHPKTVISPHTTEEVKVIFMPKHPGIYIAEVHVASSPVVADSEAALVQASAPQIVTIQGLAEKPNIEVLESDEGSVNFGNVNQNTSESKSIMLVNRGRATVPIRISLISGSLMHHLSFNVGEKSIAGMATQPVHTTLAGHENQAAEPPSVAVWVHIKSSGKLSSSSSSSGNLGPPDVISGQLQVEFDTPEQHEYLAVLPIKGLVGIARLHAPRSLQVLEFASSVGQHSSRNLPLKNAGNLRLDIHLSVTRAKELFTMVPEKLSIEPGDDRDILVKYSPKEAPSEVESVLIIQVVPDGPQYEVVVRGKATPYASKSKAPSTPPILCTKQFVVWGGVPVGRALQQKMVLKNNSETQLMKLKLSIRGNTQDFQLQSSFGQQEKLTDNRQVLLKPSEEFPVHILFAPTSEGTMQGTLVIKPNSGNTKFTVPLSGYGGVSSIILNGLTHVGDTYLSNIMNVTAGKIRTLSFEALNTGSRAAFVKIIPFADLKASEKLESKRISIKPNEFILQKEKLQKITLTLHLTKTDEVLCCQQSHLLCAVGIFYGDEITRHQFRRAQKTGTAKKVVLSSSNPLKDVVFDKPFFNEENIDEKCNLPPTPNDSQLFYSCMSRLMVSLIGASKEADESIQYEGDWNLKQTSEFDNQMQTLPRSKDTGKERIRLTSNSPPNKETPAPPSSHNAILSSVISSNSDSGPWSIQPEQLVLHAQSHTVSKGRVQVINYTDRSLSFELTWPGHCLTVTPQTGVVEPRSQILVLVSPSPALASRGVQLPWGGSVYIKCDGILKEIKVQIREDMALDTSIYPSAGHLQSLNNQPSTPAETIGVPKLPVTQQIIVKSRTVSFEETRVGNVAEATVEFKSMTTEVLRWCLSSFAPAYVKQDGGEVFRATYSAFRFAKQSGSILSGQEFKVLVTFIPREVGRYSQYWNLEYEPRERMSETKSVRIEMTGVATRDGPERLSKGGQDSRPMTTEDNPDRDHHLGKNSNHANSCYGIGVEDSELMFPTTELHATSMLKVVIRNRTEQNQEVKFLSPQTPFMIKHFKHVIRNGHYARLPVFFKPTHPGKFSGTVVIQTSSDQKLAVKLHGEAV